MKKTVLYICTIKVYNYIPWIPIYPIYLSYVPTYVSVYPIYPIYHIPYRPIYVYILYLYFTYKPYRPRCPLPPSCDINQTNWYYYDLSVQKRQILSKSNYIYLSLIFAYFQTKWYYCELSATRLTKSNFQILSTSLIPLPPLPHYTLCTNHHLNTHSTRIFKTGTNWI